VVGVGQVGEETDGDRMSRTMYDLDGVAASHFAFFVNRQVSSRPVGLREAIGKLLILHLYAQLPARLPGLGDLELGTADAPPLSD
jgi:hypothetical protein